MTANAGDQVNQLHSEIARLKEEHSQNVSSIQSQNEVDKTHMESDFDRRMAELRADYERQLAELTQSKDQEREALRAELQARITELLK